MICQIIQFNKYRDRYDNNIEYKEYYFWTKFMWMCSYDRFGYDKWIEQSIEQKHHYFKEYIDDDDIIIRCQTHRLGEYAIIYVRTKKK